MEDSATRIPAPTSSPLARLRSLLPDGRALTDEAFEVRHRLAMRTIVVLVPVLGIIGIRNGWPLGHVAIELLTVIIPGLAGRFATTRTRRMLGAALALPLASAVLVHFTSGLIESHFLFFVLLPLISMYQDWRAFLSSIGVVVFHHAVIGTVTPQEIYNHPAALEKPVLWALVHASFVIALVVILLIAWKFIEDEQEATRTALKELQEAHRLEAIGQLAAGVAHEINTPIQYIGDNLRFLETTFIDLLALASSQAAAIARDHPTRDGPADASELDFLREEVPQAVTQSIAGIDQVADIVRALKGLTHPDTGEQRLVDLNELVANTVTVAGGEWRLAATLETSFDRQLPLILCHAGPISQAVLNLVVNAAHAVVDRFGEAVGPSIGRITLSTKLDGACVELRVGDNGCGIPVEARHRLYEQFFTTKDVGRGSGQGLPITRQVVVEGHAGTLEFESTPNVGTTFIVRLPLAGRPATTSPSVPVSA